MDGMSQSRMGMVDRRSLSSCSERLIDARMAEISGLARAEGKATMSADEELVDVVCAVLSQSHPSADSTTDSPGRSRRTRNLYAPPTSTLNFLVRMWRVRRVKHGEMAFGHLPGPHVHGIGIGDVIYKTFKSRWLLNALASQ